MMNKLLFFCWFVFGSIGAYGNDSGTTIDINNIIERTSQPFGMEICINQGTVL